MAIKIERVEPGSEAEALGLAPGDELLAVDENELNDSLDYDFYTDSSSFHLKAKVADGIREWNVQRTERGPFGCDFKTYLGDQKHSCSNHCMFCFIDRWMKKGIWMWMSGSARNSCSRSPRCCFAAPTAPDFVRSAAKRKRSAPVNRQNRPKLP